MRPELQHIERIEQYLQGTMDASEKILFEKELAVNPDLKDAVDTQQLMVTAINRKALLAQVQTFAPPTGPRSGVSGSQSLLSKFKWPIILSSFVGAAVIGWFASRKAPIDEVPKTANSSIVVQRGGAGDMLPSAEGAIAEAIDFTYNPARETRTHRSSQKDFGGLQPWVRPELQTVYVDPQKDELIQCKEGTVILVPKESFVDASGQIVRTPVALEIIEALTVDKMIAYNLTTMSGDMALRSAGMVYVQPKLGDAKLSLAEGKHIHIEIPTDNYDTAMMAWEGVPDGGGNINWENPKQLENYLIPVPISTLDFLPDGFREEVQATLPFKNHQVSSEQLEDSLYYALSASATETRDQLSIETEPYKLPIKVGAKEDDGRENDINTTFSNRELKIKKGLGQGKAKHGSGIIQLENLEASEYYEVIVYFDDFTFNSEVTKGKKPSSGIVNVPRQGRCTVALQRKGCDPVVFNNVQLQNGEATQLTNPGTTCDRTDATTYVSAVLEGSSDDKCYIDPAAIFAIHQENFENTFVATREFNERLQVLHTMKNGGELLDLYLTQLNKNLHEIDAQVAARLSGSARNKFVYFAGQKLTNVKPEGQDYKALRNYYAQELKKQRQDVQARMDDYARKTNAELSEIRAQFEALESSLQQRQAAVIQKYVPKNTTRGVAPPVLPVSTTSSFVSSFKKKNSKPNVVRSSYKVNWFGTGWVNIDAYAKMLSSGERIVKLNVSEPREGQKMYTTINSLKTVLPLNNMGSGYEAHFPLYGNTEVYENSAAFAIKRKENNRIEMAVATYNPYVRSDVTLNDWKEYSEEEFMQVLKDLNPSTQQLVIEMGREKLRLMQEEERRKRAQELEEQKNAELKALEAQFNEEKGALDAKKMRLLEKQEKERRFIQNLENKINPCYSNYQAPNIPSKYYADRQNGPEVRDADFPGGEPALKRFIADNLKYPEEALEQEIQGTVMIELILDPSGNITRRRVMNITPGMELLEAEALRIVDRMPKWNPGSDEKGPVGIRYRFPIKFEIAE